MFEDMEIIDDPSLIGKRLANDPEFYEDMQDDDFEDAELEDDSGGASGSGGDHTSPPAGIEVFVESADAVFGLIGGWLSGSKDPDEYTASKEKKDRIARLAWEVWKDRELHISPEGALIAYVAAVYGGMLIKAYFDGKRRKREEAETVEAEIIE